MQRRGLTCTPYAALPSANRRRGYPHSRHGSTKVAGSGCAHTQLIPARKTNTTIAIEWFRARVPCMPISSRVLKSVRIHRNAALRFLYVKKCPSCVLSLNSARKDLFHMHESPEGSGRGIGLSRVCVKTFLADFYRKKNKEAHFLHVRGVGMWKFSGF